MTHPGLDVALKHDGLITADLAPNTTYSRLPDEVDLHQPVTVDIAFPHGSAATTVAEPLTPEE